MKSKHLMIVFSVILLLSLRINISAQSNSAYPIVDTGQQTFYNNTNEISAPSQGELFYGQDAQFNGNQPSYTDNGDGTITDNVTGLMWSQTPDLNNDGVIDADDKLTYYDAIEAAESLTLAGYNDWRIPSIKELYSLMMFYGLDPSGYNGSTEGFVPFINTQYFEFGYGDESAGERSIDAQFATTSVYVGTVMGGQSAMFGLNLADGRIKGYPIDPTPMDPDGKGYYVLFVRGNTDYGINDFVNNNNGTITDNATGLMWTQNDSGEGMNWEDALAWVQQKNNENYLGHDDWRLPNIKELQSLIDYTRCPQTTNSAAIDPLFNCSTIIDEGGDVNYPFYWSGTTHINMVNGSNAAYAAFGEALGFMQDPFGGNYTLMDVHGAGAQRSDPKTGDPDDYPYGHGPQGDVIRIYNYVRLVRDADVQTSIGDNESTLPDGFVLNQNYPNPFNPSTTISFSIQEKDIVKLAVYDSLGREVEVLINNEVESGFHSINYNAESLSSGVYYYSLTSGGLAQTKKLLLVK